MRVRGRVASGRATRRASGVCLSAQLRSGILR